MIIFGGFIAGERTNEVMLYGFQSTNWTLIDIPEGAAQPCARSGHAAALKDGNMYVFGGKGDDQEKLNDLWVFNYINQTWTCLESPPMTYVPKARSGHTM